MKRGWLFFWIVLTSLFLRLPIVAAQNLYWPVYVISSLDAGFDKWLLYNEEDELIGTLRLSNPISEERTEWMYDISDQRGIIRLKLRSTPPVWELFGDNKSYMAMPVFAGDLSVWSIKGNGINMILQANNAILKDHWVSQENAFGSFEMRTFIEGDYREWEVYERFPEQACPHFHLFCIFIVLRYAM